MTKNRMDLVRQIRKWLEEDADDMLREMLRLFAQVLMGAEADLECGAVLPLGEHKRRAGDGHIYQSWRGSCTSCQTADAR